MSGLLRSTAHIGKSLGAITQRTGRRCSLSLRKWCVAYFSSMPLYVCDIPEDDCSYVYGSHCSSLRDLPFRLMDRNLIIIDHVARSQTLCEQLAIHDWGNCPLSSSVSTPRSVSFVWWLISYWSTESLLIMRKLHRPRGWAEKPSVLS